MIYKQAIDHRGKIITLDAIRIDGKVFTISSGFLRTASLKDVWRDDVCDPDSVVQALKAAPMRIDLLRFWQRIPETTAKFSYYKEWREIAAIPVSTYDHWWNKQVNAKTRNMVRKAEKTGVRIEEISLNDAFVQGVVEIFNESPVKRGKPFWHYGKDFKSVKRDLSMDLGQAIFIGAFYNDEVIGFIKLLVVDQSAMVTMILDKQSRRDKSPMNGLIAKAVEVTAARNIPFITYTVWRRGDHGEFQKRNGFEKYPVPEYFVPMSFRGKLALHFGLHKGMKGVLPEKVYVLLLALRAKWCSVRYRKVLKSGANVQELSDSRPGSIPSRNR